MTSGRTYEGPTPPDLVRVDVPTATVPYRAFNEQALDLYPWRGNRIALLTPSADLAPEVMGRILGTFDKVYDYY